MNHSPSTCWTMIQDAADGDAASREEFARRYAPVLEAYLQARWRDTRSGDVGDAASECRLQVVSGGAAAQAEQAGAQRGPADPLQHGAPIESVAHASPSAT